MCLRFNVCGPGKEWQIRVKRGKKIAVGILSAAVVVLLFAVLQRLVQPKYADDILEGNFTAEYYQETTKHDVLMIGDCEVYENFDPIYLWKNYGITSYIRGNAQQLTWQSYYMLEDTLKYEKPKHHTFCGGKTEDVILLCNRNNRQITARQIQTGEVSMLAGGVRIQGADLQEIAKIRTWQELLFPLHGKVEREYTAEAAAQTVWNTEIMELLQSLHEEKGAFLFRIEYKGSLDERKKSEFVKKTASLLEEKSERMLINSISDYEIEIRIVESKKGGYLPFLRLYTMEDERFVYRKESIAASIAPVNAALIMQIAGDYLKENAQVLDPFCGVGTMLIERKYFRSADPLYGVDIYAEGIQKARDNTAVTRMPIHYIARDFFTFEHDYLFDELITDMPASADEAFYRTFFKKAETLLKRGAVLVLYNRQGTLLEEMCRRQNNLTILKTAVLNERQNSKVVVAKLQEA